MLRAARLPRGRSPARRPAGGGRQGTVRSGAGAARRRAAPSRGRGLRLRARPAVRHRAEHAVASPEEAARSRHRGCGTPRAVGLLLRDPRGAGGPEDMAELTDTADIRDAVRERYAAAATSA